MQLHYTEMKHSDWLLQVEWLVWTNQSASLCVAKLLYIIFVYDICSRTGCEFCCLGCLTPDLSRSHHRFHKTTTTQKIFSVKNAQVHLQVKFYSSFLTSDSWIHPSADLNPQKRNSTRVHFKVVRLMSKYYYFL